MTAVPLNTLRASVVRPAAVALCVAVLMVAVGGCASTQHAPETDRSVITLEQIQAANLETAYDLVSRFRADFLRPRGPNSLLLKRMNEPRVYLDTVDYGTVSSLRNIQAASIAGIRFIEGRDAMTKYGSEHGAGVIEIYTRY